MYWNFKNNCLQYNIQKIIGFISKNGGELAWQIPLYIPVFYYLYSFIFYLLNVCQIVSIAKYKVSTEMIS